MTNLLAALPGISFLIALALTAVFVIALLTAVFIPDGERYTAIWGKSIFLAIVTVVPVLVMWIVHAGLVVLFGGMTCSV